MIRKVLVVHGVLCGCFLSNLGRVCVSAHENTQSCGAAGSQQLLIELTRLRKRKDASKAVFSLHNSVTVGGKVYDAHLLPRPDPRAFGEHYEVTQ